MKKGFLPKGLAEGYGAGGCILAFSLALIVGLTPLFSPHNLIVLFLLLFLRANILLFTAAAILFSLLSLLLAPFIELLGLFILLSSSLESLWTALYGSTFWRFFGYNDSAVAGGIFLAFLLMVPLYLFVRRSAWFQTKFQRSGAKETSGRSQRSASLFRTSGLRFFAVGFVLSVILILLFKDIYLKGRFEDSLENIFGTRVDIESFDHSFSPPKVSMSGVTVDYPASASGRAVAVEVESVEIDLDGSAFLARSNIAEFATVTGLKFFAPPQGLDLSVLPGAFPYKGALFAIPELEPISASEVMALEELKTPRLASSLRADIDKETEELLRFLRGLPDKEKFDKLGVRLDQLGGTTKGGAFSILSATSEADNIEKSVKADLVRIEGLKKEYYRNLSRFGKRLKKAKAAPLKEIVKLTSKYTTSSIDIDNLSQNIFGPAIKGWADTAFWWYSRVNFLTTRSERLVSGRAVALRPIGGGARFVRYDGLGGSPLMLVRSADIAGMAGPYAFRGKAYNLTPDQDITGLPAVFSIQGEPHKAAEEDEPVEGGFWWGEEGSKEPLQASLGFDATLVHFISGDREDLISLMLSTHKVDGLPLGESGALGASVKDGTVDVELTALFEGDEITATLDISLSNLKIDIEATSESAPVAVAVAKELRSVDSLDLKAVISGLLTEGYDLKVLSSLDAALARAAGVAVAGEGTAFEGDLIALVTKAVKGELEEAEASLKGFMKFEEEFGARLDAAKRLVGKKREKWKPKWPRWGSKKKK